MSTDINKYVFTMIQCDGTSITLTGNKELLDDVIENFKSWLNGCGYSSSLIDRIGLDQEGY